MTQILWLDLETTGNTDDDEIIEIGAVLTDESLNELSGYERVYRTRRSISDINPFVQKMHFDNGLWAETASATAYADDVGVEGDILGWLGQNGALKSPLPLAGSGVSHFDRKYIRKTWPRLDRRLTYWHYDVGVLRRFLRLYGYGLPAFEGKAHRALDDARQHLEEARYYGLYLDLHTPGGAVLPIDVRCHPE